jgi:ATP-dependent Clp protease ATP-binding subunit ClpA
LDISPDQVRGQLGHPDPDPAADDGELTRQAWLTLAAALEATIDLGHNYLGSEHVILGLLATEDSAGGQVLRDLGADPVRARRVLTSMLSAYQYGREKTVSTGADMLGEVMRRLDSLESKVASISR